VTGITRTAGPADVAKRSRLNGRQRNATDFPPPEDSRDDGKEAKMATGVEGGSAKAAISLEYKLPGPQVEPTAGLWIDGQSRICVPTLKDVTDISEGKTGDTRLELDFAADFPSGNDFKLQLATLAALQGARGQEPYPGDRPFGPALDKDGPFRTTPLSRFLQLQPIPFGTVFDTVERRQTKVRNVLEQHARILADNRVINEGRELARAFENETPGLFHRHALNWALFNRADISPPRQARAWMALDIAIYTALTAAWHYKWLRKPYSRLLRPEEYDIRNKGEDELRVLFDRAVGEQGQENGMERDCPMPTPGTPRHPAWPSGHSTYSAAASYILEYLFSPDTLKQDDRSLFEDFPPGSVSISEPGWFAAEIRRLANNIGEARLWAGVHWVSDHVAGQKIGRAAGAAVIRQLEQDCIPPVMPRPCNSTDVPPTDQEIAQMAGRGADPCPPGQDTIPPSEDRGASFVAAYGVT
jgi:membrane-associated phospholipid phosphatase